MSESSKVNWIPLESNPDGMNKFLVKLGVPDKFKICDVYGLDPELLSAVPQPVLAVVLLFPINDKFESFFKKEVEQLKQEGQELSPGLYFMTQTINNACGAIALLHAVANNLETIQLADGALKDFLEANKDKTPEERGRSLEENSGIASAHEESAQEGQTEAPNPGDKVDLHFVAFVAKEGRLYELDGRKPFPIYRGPSSPETFLGDVAAVCQHLMMVDPDEMRFNLVALTAADEEA